MKKIVTCCLALLCSISLAYAESDCLSGLNAWRTKNVYKNAFRRGTEMIQEKWKGAYGQDCTRIYDLEEEMAFIFGNVPQDNIVAKCNQEGYHDAANAKLDAINRYCDTMGSDDGFSLGYREGGQYCREDPILGQDYVKEFRNGCTKGFRQAVTEQCKEKLNRGVMKSYMLLVCK
ncbi:hypothetical protein KCM76_03290 [Zooshikella marina]|uniref:hypothetical protein n=1 Tax=Zooshikella ganghwensis TaxID=202772 RepID=UPI001BAF8182|nr:hypothetical protein [Zooshikella ganghwensis]MBU2704988.1 hypothetical protein [Zooshikella ganghwensis]